MAASWRMPSGTGELCRSPFLRAGDVVASICLTEKWFKSTWKSAEIFRLYFTSNRDSVTKKGSTWTKQNSPDHHQGSNCWEKNAATKEETTRPVCDCCYKLLQKCNSLPPCPVLWTSCLVAQMTLCTLISPSCSPTPGTRTG